MRRLIIRLIGVSFGVGVALLLFSGVAFGNGYQAHAATAQPSASISVRNSNRFPVRNVRVVHSNVRVNVRNVRVNVHRNIRVNVHRNIRINVHRNVRVNFRTNIHVRAFRVNTFRVNTFRVNTFRSPIFGPFGFGTSCRSCCHGFGRGI
jgi:hypothetical protein